MKFFRSIGRYFRDAGRSVIRNFSLSLASISCITITLVVVALSIVLSYNVEKMTMHVSSNISIVAFLKEEFNATNEKELLEKQLKDISNVNEIKFKSKKEYLSSERSSFFEKRSRPGAAHSLRSHVSGPRRENSKVHVLGILIWIDSVSCG